LSTYTSLTEISLQAVSPLLVLVDITRLSRHTFAQVNMLSPTYLVLALAAFAEAGKLYGCAVSVDIDNFWIFH
jgi:hypothetical protein